MRKYIDFYPDENFIICEDVESIVKSHFSWNEFRGKKILITGGGGFLASYMVKTFLYANEIFNLNLIIICLVRGHKSKYFRLKANHVDKNLVIINKNFSDYFSSGDLPKIDIIIHSASQASPKYYGVDPVGTITPNIHGTSIILDYAIKSRVEKILYFSSAEVYGSPYDSLKPITENDYGYIDPLNIRSCYAESKRMAETLCISYGHQYGINVNIVRPFHTYGPNIDLDDGRVFADFVSDVVDGRDIILKSDGMAKRSLCYVSDSTLGFLKVLCEGKNLEAYNIANPLEEISIKQLAEMVSNLFPARSIGVKMKVEVINNNYLKSQVDRCFPSIEKAKKLGWQPKVGLREGFTRTINSFIKTNDI